ncbi:MAG: class I SAM-dependent methyltransferase [Cellvibrionaceae bacterium]
MTSQEILDYYSDTSERDIRDDLIFASKTAQGKIAIDCGCGAGADIAYLREQNFTVHAFDIEEASLHLCQDRFKEDPKVFLEKASFESFKYPKADLIVADSSLFFCPEFEFNEVWSKITKSLHEDGVFCGSFLGPKDTMACPDYNREAFWPDVLTFSEQEVKSIFKNFNILRFTEHNTSGETPKGAPHHWHIFAVVAQKES